MLPHRIELLAAIRAVSILHGFKLRVPAGYGGVPKLGCPRVSSTGLTHSLPLCSIYVTFCKQCHDIVVLRSVRLDNVPTEEQDFTTTDRLNLIGAVIFTCEPILDVIGVYCSTWIRTLRVVVSAGMEFKTIPITR